MNTTLTKSLSLSDDMVMVPRKEYERFLSVVKIIPQDQVWFWTPEWQQKEKEAENDIRKGKLTGPFSSGKELLKSLKS